MELLQPGTVNVRTLSPLALAFVGDGVYELMVRERLVREANRPAGVLHKRAVELVRAEAQAAAMERLLPLLTEEEAAADRRGRKALFGYLYLSGHIDRVRELFAAAIGDNTGA